MSKQEKTMIASILLSMWGPIVTGIAITMNQSSTQIVDFIRRTVELMTLVASLSVYRYVLNAKIDKMKKHQLEHRVKYIVASTILVSALVILYVFVSKISDQTIPTGNIILGASIAFLGACVNTTLWRKYVKFHKEKPNTIMKAQSSLYQVKATLDVFVFVTLISIPIFYGLKMSYWIDLVGTFIILIYMFYQSFQTFKKPKSKY